MKKMIGILVMVFIFAFAAASVLAISDDEERDGDKTIFASQNVVDDIKEDLDEQQIRSFFHEEEVILDFEHIIPVYMPLNIEESTTLSESLEFINEYNVPVVDERGNSIGMATLQLHDSKWVIGIFIENYNVMKVLDNKLVTDKHDVYFIELSSRGEFGLLKVSDSGENYISLQDGIQIKSSNSSASEILKELKQDMENNNSNLDGSGYYASFKIPFYFSSVFVIIMLAIVGTVYILKKHNYFKKL